MQFGILGPTDLNNGDVSIPLGATKQRGLLALLLLYTGSPVRVDTLVEHLWGGPTTDERRKSLYTMVSRTRAILRRSGVPHTLVKVQSVSAYRLDIDPLLVDFHRFRELVAQSRQAMLNGQYADAMPTLQRAVGLWHDDHPLADLTGAPADHLRREMNDQRFEADKLLADCGLRLGRPHFVLMQLERLIRQDHLDEGLARLWISALCAAGREDEGRRHFASFRKRFRREFRADPSIDLDAIMIRSAGAAVVSPHQLPNGVPGFTGRDLLLSELDQITRSEHPITNVVVITGMPGSGKTALAVHWSHRNLSRFPDGQLFVNAGAYGPTPPIDPREALARFLHALGVAPDRIPESLDERRQRFNDILGGRSVLIVLDNVVDPIQARPLIPHSATCCTVITSRNRLTGLTIREGARNVTSSPLSEPDSTALLTHLIGESRASEDRTALIRLAAIGGGLPLALRIIGEHVAERSRAGIAEVAGDLRDYLLWTRADDGDQDSLVSVFGWSYRSLRPEVAMLFRRLALHPGTRISIDAAAALGGLDVRTAEQILNTLAKANLLEYDIARYYQFHDLLRQFAAVCGATEDSPAEIDNHRLAILDWYLLTAANAAAVLSPELPPVPDLPARVPSPTVEFATEADALRWCEMERPNLVAAARNAAENGLHRHAWQIPSAIYEIFDRTGRHDDLLSLNAMGAASARLDGHAYGEMASLTNLGSVHFDKHQYDQAHAAFTAARVRAAQAGLIDADTVCLHNLGSVYLSTGRADLAEEIYRRVRIVCQRISYRPGEAATLHRLGDAYRLMGQSERAAEAYFEALRIRIDIGYLRGQGVTHVQLAALFLEAGDLDLAERHCASGLEIAEEIRDAAARCDALITMADIQLAACMVHTSATHARAAIEASVELRDSYRHVRALTILASGLESAGDTGEAVETCATALTILDELSGHEVGPLRERLLAIGDPFPTRRCA